jgi:hypothetical protein
VGTHRRSAVGAISVRHGARLETVRGHSLGRLACKAIGRQPQRAPDGAPFRYERHRREQTGRLVQQHAASFTAHTEAITDVELPRFVKDEFDAFLECSILAHGFVNGPGVGEATPLGDRRRRLRHARAL